MMFLLSRGNRWKTAICAFGLLAGSSGVLPAKENSSALELARQLNQAFIEVADQVSPSVVVIQVAHKPNFSETDSEGDNPFWDLIPRQYRQQFEQQQKQQREKQRRD